MTSIEKYKAAYWGIGVVVTIFVHVLSYNNMEGAYHPILLLFFMGLPSSLIVYMLAYFLLSIIPLDRTDISNIELNTIIIFFVLLAGHIQWFYFYPRLTRNEGDNENIMRNLRNFNSGNNKKEKQATEHAPKEN